MTYAERNDQIRIAFAQAMANDPWHQRKNMGDVGDLFGLGPGRIYQIVRDQLTLTRKKLREVVPT